MLGRRDGRYLRIGHRGAAALAPANTLEAIDAALAAGLDGVEIDVVAVDGEIRLAHSLRERTAMSPTLDEALELFTTAGAANVLVHVDVKRPGFEERVVDALVRSRLLERAVVSSYFHPTLRAVRRAEPALPTGLGYPYDRTGLAERYVPGRALRAGLWAMRRALPARIGGMVRGAEATVAMLHHLVLSPAVMERCRALGVPVWAWTVNDRAALERADALGVDAVVTDDPRVFGDSGA
jgi:glycerophosphoryl diester phosphodiesterase